jgi:hypothetical protein
VIAEERHDQRFAEQDPRDQLHDADRSTEDQTGMRDEPKLALARFGEDSIQ